MKKALKKISAAFLALAMIVSITPMTGFTVLADENETEAPAATEEPERLRPRRKQKLPRRLRLLRRPRRPRRLKPLPRLKLQRKQRLPLRLRHLRRPSLPRKLKHLPRLKLPRRLRHLKKPNLKPLQRRKSPGPKNRQVPKFRLQETPRTERSGLVVFPQTVFLNGSLMMMKISVITSYP